MQEKKKFHIIAMNAAELPITMSIVERSGTLYLLNGLDIQKLVVPKDWKWEDIETEVKRVSGITRMVMTNA